jgi:hypothetical protein
MAWFRSNCGASLNEGGNNVSPQNGKKDFNVLALIGMISGILAVVWCWWSVVGIVGVLFGIAAVK